MADQRQVKPHLLPEIVPTDGLRGATAVAIDVLHTTATMITALAAGRTDIQPCGTVEETKAPARSLRAGQALLGGERHNVKIEGLDLGYSPLEYSAKVCRG
jgi:2-phosphosulfolactate phosphatase